MDETVRMAAEIEALRAPCITCGATPGVACFEDRKLVPPHPARVTLGALIRLPIPVKGPVV